MACIQASSIDDSSHETETYDDYMPFYGEGLSQESSLFGHSVESEDRSVMPLDKRGKKPVFIKGVGQKFNQYSNSFYTDSESSQEYSSTDDDFRVREKKNRLIEKRRGAGFTNHDESHNPYENSSLSSSEESSQISSLSSFKEREETRKKKLFEGRKNQAVCISKPRLGKKHYYEKFYGGQERFSRNLGSFDGVFDGIQGDYRVFGNVKAKAGELKVSDDSGNYTLMEDYDSRKLDRKRQLKASYYHLANKKGVEHFQRFGFPEARDGVKFDSIHRFPPGTFDYSKFYGTGNEATALLLKKYTPIILKSDDKDVFSYAVFNREGDRTKTLSKYNMPKHDPTVSINKEGEGTVIFTGDFSRYNGKINIKEGVAAFENSRQKEFPKGDVKLWKGTVLELNHDENSGFKNDRGNSLNHSILTVFRKLETKNDATIDFSPNRITTIKVDKFAVDGRLNCNLNLNIKQNGVAQSDKILANELFDAEGKVYINAKLFGTPKKDRYDFKIFGEKASNLKLVIDKHNNDFGDYKLISSQKKGEVSLVRVSHLHRRHDSFSDISSSFYKSRSEDSEKHHIWHSSMFSSSFENSDHCSHHKHQKSCAVGDDSEIEKDNESAYIVYGKYQPKRWVNKKQSSIVKIEHYGILENGRKLENDDEAYELSVDDDDVPITITKTDIGYTVTGAEDDICALDNQEGEIVFFDGSKGVFSKNFISVLENGNLIMSNDASIIAKKVLTNSGTIVAVGGNKLYGNTFVNKTKGSVYVKGKVIAGNGGTVINNYGEINILAGGEFDALAVTDSSSKPNKLYNKGTITADGVLRGNIYNKGTSKKDAVITLNNDFYGKIENYNHGVVNAREYVKYGKYDKTDFPDGEYLYDLNNPVNANYKFDPTKLTPVQLENAAFYELVSNGKYKNLITKFKTKINGIDLITNHDGGVVNIVNPITSLTGNDAIFVRPGQTITLPAANKYADSSFAPAIFSINGYSNGVMGNVVDVDKTAVVEKVGNDKLTLTGNNSWFNGVFNLRAGSINVKENGALFGGVVNLSDGTDLIWEGGPKDEYNKPDVRMQGSSSIHFNLVNDPTVDVDNSVFSFFGTIQGAQTATIYFQQGLTYIKGDCSGFTGNVNIMDGANFVVKKKAGVYEGKMFGGNVHIFDKDGNPGGNATVTSNSGLNPLVLNTGNITLVQDPTATASDNSVNNVTIKGGANLVSNLTNPIFSKAVINGGMTLGGSGTSAVFDNLDINGGLLTVNGDNLSDIAITGSFNVGSGINMMGNGVIDTIDASKTSGINIYPGRNFDLWIDLDPASNRADNIIAPNCTYTTGSNIEIMDFKLLSAPTKEYHIFRVLKLLDPNATYTPIMIGKEAAEKKIQGALGAYKLYAEGGGGMLVLRLPNVSIDPKILQEAASDQSTLFFSGTSNMSSIFSEVTDEINSYRFQDKKPIMPKKYRFWNRTRGGVNKIATNFGNINAGEYGTLFGVDIPNKVLKNDINLMSTIFINYGKQSFKYLDKNERQNKYLVGGRLAWFNKLIDLELLACYEFSKSNINAKSSKNTIKRHALSVGGKAGYSIVCTDSLKIKPDILADFSLIKTPNIKIGDNNIKTKSQKVLNVCPGVNFIFDKGNFETILTARYHRRIFGDTKSYINGEPISQISEKKTHMEYALNFRYKTTKSLEIGAGVSKFTGGKKGMKFTLQLGLRPGETDRIEKPNTINTVDIKPVKSSSGIFADPESNIKNNVKVGSRDDVCESGINSNGEPIRVTKVVPKKLEGVPKIRVIKEPMKEKKLEDESNGVRQLYTLNDVQKVEENTSIDHKDEGSLLNLDFFNNGDKKPQGVSEEKKSSIPVIQNTVEKNTESKNGMPQPQTAQPKVGSAEAAMKNGEMIGIETTKRVAAWKMVKKGLDISTIAECLNLSELETAEKVGIEKGKEETIISTAKNMLKKGIDLQIISECLGITIEDVKKYTA